MSKIRMALMNDCAYIAIAYIHKSGQGQAIRINLPRRKQELLQKVLKDGLDFPDSKPVKPASKIGQTDAGVVYKKPSLIIPASAMDQPMPQPQRPRQPGEITL